MSGKVDLDGYVPVSERIAQLRAVYPDASLQPVNPAEPYRIETVGDLTFVVYAAACYRTPDDPRPGIGVAWEQFPGRTNFTRNSELMNAETSAWGRAIVAALAADTQRGIATREDVQHRHAEQTAPSPLQPLLDTVQSLVAALPDTAPWEAWKREHRGWHKSERLLVDAREALTGMIAATGAEPWDEEPFIPAEEQATP